MTRSNRTLHTFYYYLGDPYRPHRIHQDQRYLRWQPCGFSALSPKKPGLHLSQRGPCTCPLQRHCPAISLSIGSSCVSHTPPSSVPSGSQSQATKAGRRVQIKLAPPHKKNPKTASNGNTESFTSLSFYSATFCRSAILKNELFLVGRMQ